MPKRKIDPNTCDAMLTTREEKLIHEFLTKGGNGTQAAASAGYSAARPSSSAYQVLHRPEVQRRIRQRFAELQVSAHEIIGTLASRTMSFQNNPQKLNLYQCFSGPQFSCPSGAVCL